MIFLPKPFDTCTCPGGSKSAASIQDVGAHNEVSESLVGASVLPVAAPVLPGGVALGHLPEDNGGAANGMASGMADLETIRRAGGQTIPSSLSSQSLTLASWLDAGQGSDPFRVVNLPLVADTDASAPGPETPLIKPTVNDLASTSLGCGSVAGPDMWSTVSKAAPQPGTNLTSNMSGSETSFSL
jgi:hypothetical protein